MESAALFVLYAVVPAAILAWCSVLLYRTAKMTWAANRADRRYEETSAAMDRGEITPLEAVARHNETHAAFLREAPRG